MAEANKPAGHSHPHDGDAGEFRSQQHRTTAKPAASADPLRPSLSVKVATLLRASIAGYPAPYVSDKITILQ